jgi:arsenate reductase (thioredoxin)
MSRQLQTKTPKRTKVLFVCIGNSCRSQMGEALARHLASDVMEPSSAGLAPLGEIAHLTEMVLQERGVPIDGQYSKGLDEMGSEEAEIIVNMTGTPGRAVLLGSKARVEDWPVGDPYGEDIDRHRRVCSEIERRVTDLADCLRRQQAKMEKR